MKAFTTLVCGGIHTAAAAAADRATHQIIGEIIKDGKSVFGGELPFPYVEVDSC